MQKLSQNNAEEVLIECMQCFVFTDEVEECKFCKEILCFDCHSEHEADESIEHTTKEKKDGNDNN